MCMNIRFFIIFVSLLALISCGGAEERKAFYLEKAKTSLLNEDYEKAKIDLKNTLQIDPKNSEALYLLGTLHEEMGKYDAAYKQYTRALEYDDKNIDALYRLAIIYLHASRFEKANELLGELELIDPVHLYTKSLKAAIQFSSRDYEAAIKMIDSIERSSWTENVYSLYSASIYKLGDVGKSIYVLEEAVEKYPDNAELYGVLASLYESSGEMEKAEIVYNKLLIVNNSAQQYFKLSKFYERNNEPEKASDVYVKLVQSDPENENYQLLRVRYIEEKQGIKKAIELMESLINDFPESYIYKVSLSKLYIQNKNNVEAISLLNHIVSENYSDKSVVAARNILAALALNEGNTNMAKKELSEVNKINPNDIDANFMLGTMSLKSEKYEEAINAFRVVIRGAPERAAAYLYLAKALKYQGSIDLARDVLARGYQLSPNNIGLTASFIEILLDNGEYEHAINLIEKLPANDIASLKVLNLKGKVYFSNKKYSESLALAKVVISKYPKSGKGYLLAAGSNVKLNQLEAASRVLRNGLNLTSSAQLLLAYANIEKSLGRTDKLITYLESYQEFKPVVFNLLAELYMHVNRVDKAEEYFNQAISQNSKWNIPYKGLATLYLSNGEIERSMEILEEGLNAVDNGLDLKIMKADLLSSLEKNNQAALLYDQVLLVDPDNIIAINNLAVLLVDKFNDEAQYERAYNLVNGLENHSDPMVLDTVGWVYTKSGRYTDAISVLSNLVERLPNVDVFRYHLGMTYYYKGDLDKAYETIKKFVGSKTENKIWFTNVKNIADEYEKKHLSVK